MNKKAVIVISSLIVLASASYLFYVLRRNSKYNKIQEESFEIYVEK